MRLTVLGTGTARPVADTAASGLLVQTAGSSVLFDIGTGIASRVEATVGATNLSGLVVGHFHADHWIDVAPLRYRFPWAGPVPRPLPVFLPPGGNAKLETLASAINERPTFFHDAFVVTEYEDGRSFEVGELVVTPRAVGHYVPAWSMDIVGPDGERMVYAGDMGPSDALIEYARGAQMLVLEATLEFAYTDDERRGHLTVEEAIEHVVRADVPRGLLVHYPSERREAIAGVCAATDGRVRPAVAGMVTEIEAAERPLVQETVSRG